jgi:thiamine monophosphate synthase
MMTLGLDIDGTITRHPAFFAAMSQAFRAVGHRVVIITFREDRERTLKDLAAWGVVFDELVTSSLSEQLEHGVNEWKGVVCQAYGVQVLIDDDADVVKALGPPTLGLLVVPG